MVYKSWYINLAVVRRKEGYCIRSTLLGSKSGGGKTRESWLYKMQKMCNTWCAFLACVIMFLSILASVRCLPLDNSPSTLHRKSFTSEEDDRETDLSTLLNSQSTGSSTTHHKVYWWQFERASGVQAVEDVDTLAHRPSRHHRDKRFPRIVSIVTR